MKMIFKNINILDENFEIMEGGYLATESGKISYVGEKKPNEKFDRETDTSRVCKQPLSFAYVPPERVW